MNLKKTLLAAITFLTLVLFTAALVSWADEGEIKCPKTIKVEVAKIIGQQFEEYKAFKANVFPEVTAVKSLVDGQITDVKVSAGDLVSKNLEMLIINDGLAKEIKALEEELKKNQRVLRARQGWKERSAKAEQQAEGWVKESEAKLAEKKAAVPDYIIIAPDEGKIKSLKVGKDDEISAGDVLAEIENTAKMFAAVLVSAEEKAMFSAGQEIGVMIKETDAKYKAVVAKIAEDKIVLLVENRVKEIKENYTLIFNLLQKEHKDVVVLPKSKILKDDTGIYVFKVEGKYAVRADLKIGAITGENCLVTEGLAIGDEIIVSEILSAKEGTVKDTFECVKDNVKIKVMEKDPDTGVFTTRKVGKKKIVKKKVVKEKPPVKVKKPKVKKEKPAVPAENFFMAGAGAGIFYVNQTWWADVYSKGGIGYGLKVAYRLKNRYEVFAEADYVSKKGEIIPTGEETKLTDMPIYLGAKYLFKTGSKFTPFVGLAGLMNKITEDNIIAKESKSGFGFSVLVGTYFDITENLTLDLCLKYDGIKYDIEGITQKADLSGARLFLMFSYKFK